MVTPNATYYTEKEPIRVRTYGRAVQELVDHALKEPDRDKRTQMAHEIINIMQVVAPEVKEMDEYEQKLWEHLYALSNYQLDIDFPVEVHQPTEHMHEQPRMDYHPRNTRIRQYGQNVQQMVDAAAQMPEGEGRKLALERIANIMKQQLFYQTNQVPDDQLIFDHLLGMSKGQIELSKDELELLPRNQLQVQAPSNKNNPAYIRRKKKKGGSSNNKRKKRRGGGPPQQPQRGR